MDWGTCAGREQLKEITLAVTQLISDFLNSGGKPKLLYWAFILCVYVNTHTQTIILTQFDIISQVTAKEIRHPSAMCGSLLCSVNFTFQKRYRPNLRDYRVLHSLQWHQRCVKFYNFNKKLNKATQAKPTGRNHLLIWLIKACLPAGQWF